MSDFTSVRSSYTCSFQLGVQQVRGSGKMGRFARDVEAFYGGIRNGRFPRYLQYIRKETGIGDRGEGRFSPM